MSALAEAPAVITVCVVCGKSYPYPRETQGCDACGRDHSTVKYALAEAAR